MVCDCRLAGVAASCSPGRSPHDTEARYVITSNSPVSLTGVGAAIKEYDPYYSGYNPTGTNASIMLVHWLSGGGAQWAQLGWIKSKLHTSTPRRESFLEFFRSASQNYYRWFPTKAVGHNTRYWIYFTAPDRYDFFIDGNLVDEWTGSFAPDQYQLFGETHDWVDQMPGGTNGHEVFTEAAYYKYSNYVKYDMTSPMWIQSNKTVNWGFQYVTWGHYEMWDKACSS